MTQGHMPTASLTPFHCVMYVEGMEERVPSDHRLSVIRWKTPKEELKNKDYVRRPTVCVALPMVLLSLTPDCLASAMQDALGEMQDAAVREVVAAAIEATPGVNLSTIRIPEELGTPSGLAKWASTKAVSARLSTKGLEEWFDGVMAAPLVDLVTSKLPEDTPHLAEVAVAQVAKAREAIVKLASPRVTMPPAIAAQLARAIGATVASNDRTRKQLEERLAFFINPPKTEELLLNL